MFDSWHAIRPPATAYTTCFPATGTDTPVAPSVAVSSSTIGAKCAWKAVPVAYPELVRTWSAPDTTRSWYLVVGDAVGAEVGAGVGAGGGSGGGGGGIA